VKRSIAIAAFALACGPAEIPRAPAPPPASVPDAATAARAESTLVAFLAASRTGHRDVAALDTLARCGSEAEAYLPASFLASYVLLPPERRGTTLIGRAVVTTVGETDRHPRAPGRFLARVRLRTDTLEWDVVADASNRLAICNGLQFAEATPDSLTEWRPPGVSAATVQALADSVQRAAAAEPSRP
jgi:hypothetical protein